MISLTPAFVHTIGVLLLIGLVAFHEARSFHKTKIERRFHDEQVKERQV